MSETRIPKTEITGLFGAAATRFSKKMLGEVPAQLEVMWHNKSVLMTMMGMSKKAKKWRECDENLKAFAHMATMALIGCRFCLDLGYFMAHHEGLDVDKAREVPRWRESDVFTPLERDVMAYAEEMSQTPPTVTDDLSARLLKSLGAPALIELTAYVTMANMAARLNVAIGPFGSQGFAEACGLRPLAESVSTAMLTVLETLSPTERAVFVLREVFAVPYDEIAEAVERCLAAIRDGDIDGLLSVLAPDVVAVGDGGGLAPAARLPIQGANRVAKSLLLVARTKAVSMHSMRVNGALAITIEHEGKVHAVASVRVEGGRVTALYGVNNPEKLTRLDRETQLAT